MNLNIDAVGCHYGRNILVWFNVAQITENEHFLSVWRLENSLNLAHVKDESIGDYDRYAYDSLQVNEHFIAASGPKEHTVMTFNFISLKF